MFGIIKAYNRAVAAVNNFALWFEQARERLDEKLPLDEPSAPAVMIDAKAETVVESERTNGRRKRQEA